MAGRADVSMGPEEIRTFLDRPGATGVLTTLGPDGWPHSVAMWFVPRATTIEMWTYAKSQKARNARRDPKASFLVEAGEGYTQLKRVLVRGDLAIEEDYERVVGIGLALYERYVLPRTNVPVDGGPLAEIRRQGRKRVGLVLSLERVTSWDHSKV